MIEKFFVAFYILFLEMAPYLVLGFIFSGVLRYFFKDQIITKYLGGESMKSISLASFFGVPLPLCSCGVVPAGISLKRQGASKPATLSFLTSTPQTGVDSIIVTYGFLGPIFTFYKLISTFFMGISAGLLGKAVDPSTAIKEGEIQAHAVDEIKSVKEIFEYSFIELVDAIRHWLLIGLLIAAFISTFLPVDVASSLSDSFGVVGQYLAVLFIATPMYVCSTASVPIALSLITKGFPLGTAMVFLIAGPATNAATITVLWKNLGPKSSMAYLFNILFFSVAFGVIFDSFFPEAAVSVVQVSSHEHGSYGWLTYLSSALLALLILYSYAQQIIHSLGRKKLIGKDVLKVRISGMTCGGCVKKVKSAIDALDQVLESDIQLSGESIIKFKGTPLSAANIQSVVEGFGYSVEKV